MYYVFICARARVSAREREISSLSYFILPRCDVPLILIFSSQMRAIQTITVHFNFSPLNISCLWYLPLTASQVCTLLTFMCLQIERNVHQNCLFQNKYHLRQHFSYFIYLFFWAKCFALSVSENTSLGLWCPFSQISIFFSLTSGLPHFELWILFCCAMIFFNITTRELSF